MTAMEVAALLAQIQNTAVRADRVVLLRPQEAVEEQAEARPPDLAAAADEPHPL